MVCKSGLERVFSQAYVGLVASVVVGCNFIPFYSYRVSFFIYQRYEVILQLAILSDECCTSRAALVGCDDHYTIRTTTLATWLINHLMCGILLETPKGPVFLCDNAGSTCDSQADKGSKCK